jgi:hypothetical protein
VLLPVASSRHDHSTERAWRQEAKHRAAPLSECRPCADGESHQSPARRCLGRLVRQRRAPPGRSQIAAAAGWIAHSVARSPICAQALTHEYHSRNTRYTNYLTTGIFLCYTGAIDNERGDTTMTQKPTVRVYLNKTNGTLEVFDAYEIKDALKALGAMWQAPHITARDPKAWVLRATIENGKRIMELANVKPYQY